MKRTKERHGHTSQLNGMSPTYQAWSCMHSRCTPANPNHHRYFDRGIRVCPEWGSFTAFLNDMGERPDEMWLDRIDNDSIYCKSNCRWTTPKINARNRGNNNIVEYNGQRKTLMEWTEITGLPYKCLELRIKRGWPLERAFTLPKQR